MMFLSFKNQVKEISKENLRLLVSREAMLESIHVKK